MITVYGSINMDLIGTVPHLPVPGETVSGSRFETAPGGKGANQALAARRAGAPVRLLGAVGTDPMAGPALALLRADEVDLGGVMTVDGPTGTAMILVDADGENVIAVIPGANGQVNVDVHGSVPFAPGDILLLQLEIPVDAMRPLARRARVAGARVILNLAPFQVAALSLLAETDVVVVNEGEADALAMALGLVQDGTVPANDAIARTWALAHRMGLPVVTTCGVDGAVAVRGASVLSAPALGVTAVDSVGAGDTFCGYLAAGLHGGHTLTDGILTRAGAAASLACTKRGAQPSIPRAADVDAALGSDRRR